MSDEDEFIEYEFMGKKVRISKKRAAELAKAGQGPLSERLAEKLGLEMEPAEPIDPKLFD